MAYEGQIAGVGDRPPGRRLRGAAIRFMQRRSAAELAERRAAIVAAIGEFAELEIVNGGGTGSLELTGAEEAVTEVDRRLGLLRPHPLRPLQPLHASPPPPASRCRSCASPRRASRPTRYSSSQTRTSVTFSRIAASKMRGN